MMIDPKDYKTVLRSYPTGVCLVTASNELGEPAGMIIGSFASISLHPPLIGFFPGKGSTTYPKIERIGSFCVNVLGVDQLAVCEFFSGSQSDKFSNLDYECSPKGHPILRDSVAWLDCTIDRIEEIGDHWLVVGAPANIGVGKRNEPLLFHSGGFHRSSAIYASPSGG